MKYKFSSLCVFRVFHYIGCLKFVCPYAVCSSTHFLFINANVTEWWKKYVRTVDRTNSVFLSSFFIFFTDHSLSTSMLYSVHSSTFLTHKCKCYGVMTEIRSWIEKICLFLFRSFQEINDHFISDLTLTPWSPVCRQWSRYELCVGAQTIHSILLWNSALYPAPSLPQEDAQLQLGACRLYGASLHPWAPLHRTPLTNNSSVP